MKLEAAPPADVVLPWRYVPVFQTDAGARPVGTPDCCCERVSQDLDLVAGSAGGAPVSSIGESREVGDGGHPSAGSRDRRAQEDCPGGGPAARSAARRAHRDGKEVQDVLAVAAPDDGLAVR